VRDIVRKSKNSRRITNLDFIVYIKKFFWWWKSRWGIAHRKKGFNVSRKEIYVVLAYILLIVIVTWPLIWHLNNMIPGVGNDRGDSFHFVWDMWWLKKNVLTGKDLFWTNDIFYPNGVSLVYHTLIIGQGLLSLFFMLFLPLLVVFNGFYLLFMFLAAYGAYSLVKKLWGSRRAAFLGGVIFAFSPYVMAHSLGHFNLTALWPLPWIGLLSWELRKKRTWTKVVSLSLLIVFLFLNDFHYFLFGIILFGLIIGYDLFTKRFTKKNIPMLMKTAMVAVIVFVLIFPLLNKSLEVSKVYVPGALLSEVSYWSADLVSFITPSFLHSVWGNVGQKAMEEYKLGGVESVVYVGWTVIGLVLLSIVFKSADKKEKASKRVWWIILVFFFVMSLGPLLKIMGNTSFYVSDISYSIALPYIWLYKLPLLSVARAPARFFAVVSLALGVLAGYGYFRLESLILSKVNIYKNLVVWPIFLVVMFMIGLEYVSMPMRLQKMSIPPVYNNIKADKDDCTVLELPLWWTSGHRSEGDVITKIQYYQTYHEKKILNGSVSRVPDALFDYYLQYPGIKYLIDVNTKTPDRADLDKNVVLIKWKNDFNIKYIVLHKEYYEWSDYYKIREYLENVIGVEKWYEDEGEIAYVLK